MQFATEVRTGTECAIKFYISHATFAHERAVYRDPNIRAVSPEILHMYDSDVGALVDPTGRPLLSFIVFERGEALDEWARRRMPDLITSIQVIWHVADVLQNLHKANIAHRDLKPSNVYVRLRLSAVLLLCVLCSGAKQCASSWREFFSGRTLKPCGTGAHSRDLPAG